MKITRLRIDITPSPAIPGCRELSVEVRTDSRPVLHSVQMLQDSDFTGPAFEYFMDMAKRKILQLARELEKTDGTEELEG